MGRLQKLGLCCLWDFFYTAMDTLQVVWKLDSDEKGGGDWVQALKDPESNLFHCLRLSTFPKVITLSYHPFKPFHRGQNIPGSYERGVGKKGRRREVIFG